MEALILVILIFLLVGVTPVAVMGYYRWLDDNRGRDIGEIAKELQIPFERSLRATIRTRLPAFSLMRGKGSWHQTKSNSLGYASNGLIVEIFDHLNVDKDGNFLHRTVAYVKLPSRRLPTFVLCPKSAFRKVAAWFGSTDICDNADCQTQDPDFCKRYSLAGKDAAAICDLLDGDLRQHLLQLQDCSVETSGDELVGIHSSLLSPDELPLFRETIIALAQLLRDPPVATESRTALHIPLGA